jgi:hypothetical protein
VRVVKKAHVSKSYDETEAVFTGYIMIKDCICCFLHVAHTMYSWDMCVTTLQARLSAVSPSSLLCAFVQQHTACGLQE